MQRETAVEKYIKQIMNINNGYDIVNHIQEIYGFTTYIDGIIYVLGSCKD